MFSLAEDDGDDPAVWREMDEGGADGDAADPAGEVLAPRPAFAAVRACYTQARTYTRRRAPATAKHTNACVCIAARR